MTSIQYEISYAEKVTLQRGRKCTYDEHAVRIYCGDRVGVGKNEQISAEIFNTLITFTSDRLFYLHAVIM